MLVKLVNATNYANIYGLFDGDRMIGTKQVTVAGVNAGKVQYCTWSKYGLRDIRRMFKEYQ